MPRTGLAFAAQRIILHIRISHFDIAIMIGSQQRDNYFHCTYFVSFPLTLARGLSGHRAIRHVVLDDRENYNASRRLRSCTPKLVIGP